MAIAFNTAVSGGDNGGTTNSLTYSHTVSSGSNRLIVVGIVGDIGGGADDITGVTYAGVSLTFIGKSINAAQNRYVYLYYLINPTSGANNVIISCTANHYLLGGSSDFTGVSQTVLDNSTTNISSGSVSTLTTSLSTIANNCWTVLMEEGYDTVTTDPTAGAGLTKRVNDASFGTWGLFDSNGVITPAGSYSMTTNRTTAANRIAHVVASFAPATSSSLSISVSELLTSSELVTPEDDFNIFVLENVGMTDIAGSPDNTLFISEIVQVSIQQSGAVNISVFDTLTTTESVTVTNTTDFESNVSETLTTTEFVHVELDSFINVHENLTTTESVTVTNTTDFESNVFETLTTTEFVHVELDSNINVHDTLTTTESVTVTNTTDFESNVFETLTTTEFVHVELDSSINVFETLTTTESVIVTNATDFESNVFETLTTTEFVHVELDSSINVFETLTTTESITIVIGATLSLSISVFETLTTTEFIHVELDSFINVFETLTTTENISLTIPTSLNTSSSALISDDLGNSVTFNGTLSDFITIGNSYTIPLTAFSVEFWYNSGTWTSGARVVDYQDNGPSGGIAFLQNGSTGQLELVARNGATQTAGLLSAALIDGTWHHIVGTYDGTTLILYVDGQNVSSHAAVITAPTQSVTLGRRSSSVSNFFTGSLANFLIYSRTLGSSEVTSHFTGDYSSNGTSLQVWYQFQGGNAVDLSNNGNTGSVSGTTNTGFVINPYVNVSLVNNPIVSETLTTTEFIHVELDSSINVFETLTTTEFVHVELDSFINVFETLTTTEIVNLNFIISISVNDTLTTTESVTVTIVVSAFLSISVFDTLTTTEFVHIELDSNINVHETLTTTEFTQVELDSNINVHDTLTTTESISIAVLYNITTTSFMSVIENDVGNAWFDGGSGYIQIPDNDNYSIESSPNLGISFAFWLRPDVLQFANEEGSGGDRYVGLLSKEATNENEYEVRMYGTDNTVGRGNRISFYIYQLTGGIGDGVAFQDTIIPGQWIHIAGTAQDVGGGVTGIRIYKNGVNRDAFSSSLPIAAGTAPLRAGVDQSNSGSPTSYFRGGMHSLLFWNRRLSDAEITNVYNGSPSTSGLVGDFEMNNISGSTVPDTSTTGNNGSIIGTVQARGPSISVELDSYVFLFDTLTTTESVSVTNTTDFESNVFETLTTTEFVHVELDSFINVHETLTTTESVSVTNTTDFESNVFETLTTTEFVHVELDSNVNVHETLTTTEFIHVELDSNINVHETLTTTESVQIELDSNINVHETLTTTESVHVELDSNINVHETLTTTESVVLGLGLFITENITLTESVTVISTSGLNIFDTLTTTEFIHVELDSNVNVHETLTTTESVTIDDQRNISVHDTLTTTENYGFTQVISVVVNDTLILTEFDKGSLVLSLVVFDSLTTTEFIATQGLYNVTISDRVTLTEKVSSESFRFAPSVEKSVGRIHLSRFWGR